MAVAERLCRAAAKWALIYAVSQLAACAYAPLPPNVTTQVGRPSNLVCRADEAQVCRDHGSALKCSCAPVSF
jgi:hypothetical protein